jgi:hypothetical protein
MTPVEIEQAIESAFPNVRSKPRQNPDGWAFYLDEMSGGGPQSTRIARAVQKSPASSTQFKLAVSSRVEGKDVLRDVHTAKQVQEAVAEEIRLWHLHFGKSPGAA